MSMPLHKRIARGYWLPFGIGVVIGVCLHTAGAMLLVP